MAGRSRFPGFYGGGLPPISPASLPVSSPYSTGFYATFRAWPISGREDNQGGGKKDFPLPGLAEFRVAEAATFPSRLSRKRRKTERRRDSRRTASSR